MSKFKFRETLLASTMIAGLSFANPAFAQDADDPAGTTPPPGTTSAPAPSDEDTPTDGVQPAAGQDAAEETSQGDIVVTGTLIKNPNLVRPRPVTVVGQEEIQLRQTNVAEELLRELPGVVPSIGSAVNNGNGGASFVDLRGLGNNRNIVLLDGVRIVPSNFVGRVDLNNIPLALVERVDMLTGGASTTYGADAVSGVINFITRSDFAGMELEASSTRSPRRATATSSAPTLTVGANFDDGRGNAVLVVGYQEADPVYQGARASRINNYTSTSGQSPAVRERRSRRASPGPACRPEHHRPGDPGTAPAVCRPDRSPFNFNPYNIFQTPFERFNIFGAGHYEVADGIEVYTRGMFSKNTVNTIVAPSGIFGQLAADPGQQPVPAGGARAAVLRHQRFRLHHSRRPDAALPAQCAAAATATSVRPTRTSGHSRRPIGRRLVEAGPRISEYRHPRCSTIAPACGSAITDTIDLDVSGAYGESENEQEQQGYTLELAPPHGALHDQPDHL